MNLSVLQNTMKVARTRTNFATGLNVLVVHRADSRYKRVMNITSALMKKTTLFSCLNEKDNITSAMKKEDRKVAELRWKAEETCAARGAGSTNDCCGCRNTVTTSTSHTL